METFLLLRHILTQLILNQLQISIYLLRLIFVLLVLPDVVSTVNDVVTSIGGGGSGGGLDALLENLLGSGSGNGLVTDLLDVVKSKFLRQYIL